MTQNFYFKREYYSKLYELIKGRDWCDQYSNQTGYPINLLDIFYKK